MGNETVCSNDPDYLTKMAAMPIYDKPFKSFLVWNRPLSLKLGIQHRALVCYHVYSNDDPRLTCDLFYAKVNFGFLCTSIGKGVNGGLLSNY